MVVTTVYEVDIQSADCVLDSFGDELRTASSSCSLRSAWQLCKSVSKNSSSQCVITLPDKKIYHNVEQGSLLLEDGENIAIEGHGAEIEGYPEHSRFLQRINGFSETYYQFLNHSLATSMFPLVVPANSSLLISACYHVFLRHYCSSLISVALLDGNKTQLIEIGLSKSCSFQFPFVIDQKPIHAQEELYYLRVSMGNDEQSNPMNCTVPLDLYYSSYPVGNINSTNFIEVSGNSFDADLPSLQLNNVSISKFGSTTTFGGALLATGICNVSLHHIRFESNIGFYGGAVAFKGTGTNPNSLIVLKNVAFESNTALFEGGSLYIVNHDNITMQDIVVRNSTSYGGVGGGISCRNSSNLAFENMYFDRVVSWSDASDGYNGGEGGAISVVDSDHIGFHGIIANEARAYYGGSFSFRNTFQMLLQNASFYNNTAYSVGSIAIIVECTKLFMGSIYGYHSSSSDWEYRPSALQLARNNHVSLHDVVINSSTIVGLFMWKTSCQYLKFQL